MTFKESVEQMIKLLPDWAKKGEIRISSNRELVAFRSPERELKVKKVRCSNCGTCCLSVPENYFSFGTNGDGKCNKLIKDGDKWLCNAGKDIPFNCCGPVNEEDCSVEWE